MIPVVALAALNTEDASFPRENSIEAVRNMPSGIVRLTSIEQK
jgi:hypothetical protein